MERSLTCVRPPPRPGPRASRRPPTQAWQAVPHHPKPTIAIAGSLRAGHRFDLRRGCCYAVHPRRTITTPPPPPLCMYPRSSGCVPPLLRTNSCLRAMRVNTSCGLVVVSLPVRSFVFLGLPHESHTHTQREREAGLLTETRSDNTLRPAAIACPPHLCKQIHQHSQQASQGPLVCGCVLCVCPYKRRKAFPLPTLMCVCVHTCPLICLSHSAQPSRAFRPPPRHAGAQIHGLGIGDNVIGCALPQQGYVCCRDIGCLGPQLPDWNSRTALSAARPLSCGRPHLVIRAGEAQGRIGDIGDDPLRVLDAHGCKKYPNVAPAVHLDAASRWEDWPQVCTCSSSALLVPTSCTDYRPNEQVE